MAWLLEPLPPKYRNSEASVRTMTTSSFIGHGDRNRLRRDGLLSSLLVPAFSCSVPVISPCSFPAILGRFSWFCAIFREVLEFFAPLYRDLQEPLRVWAQRCTPVHFTRASPNEPDTGHCFDFAKRTRRSLVLLRRV